MIKKIVLGLFACAVSFAGFGLVTQTAFAMNKAELIEAMASESGLSKADSKRALEGFLDETTEVLKKGDRISLVGFGSFSVSKRSNSSKGADNTVEFFPDIRSKGAESRHDNAVLSAEDITRSLSEKCRNDERSKEECPSYDVLIKTLVSVTADTLAKGDFVEWSVNEDGFGSEPSFGTFTTAVSTSISKRSARTGRNPQTGKEIQIAAKNTVKFKAGAELSKAVN